LTALGGSPGCGAVLCLTHIKSFGVVTTYGSPWWITRLLAGDPGRKVLMRALKPMCGRRLRSFFHRHCVPPVPLVIIDQIKIPPIHLRNINRLPRDGHPEPSFSSHARVRLRMTGKTHLRSPGANDHRGYRSPLPRSDVRRNERPASLYRR
jgi:hypothetical protein